jgi:arylformamidase
MAVAIVGYTLCPEITVAGIVDEVATACALLHLQSRRYGLDSGRFHVAGHSAGGHLTAMMLATDWPARDARLPARFFRSGIAISGVFDLEPLTLTPLNDALRLAQDDALAVSPIFRRNQARTPLMVAVGGAETAELLRQSRVFCLAWPESEYLEAPALNHFSVIDAFHDPATALFQSAWRHMNAGDAAP